MSSPTYDIDYQLWDAYLAECRAMHLTPSVRDYMVWLQEVDADQRDNIDFWEHDYETE